MSGLPPNRLPSAPAKPPRPVSHRRLGFRHDSKRGFTLLELSVVVFIISVVAALAVPHFKQAQLNARSSAVMNDLRVFTGGFQAYAQSRGDWPPGSGAPGELPAGTETYLRQTNWERTTPIGGRYTWALNSLQQGERHRAVIVIASVEDNTVTADRRQLEDLDRKMDDGDLETGNLRLGYRNYPVFIIEH